MLRKYLAHLLSLSAVFIGTSAMADNPVQRISSFAELADASHAWDLSKTLVVMDDDDTLMMMHCGDVSAPSTCQYLGGPAWIEWQVKLIHDDPHSKFVVAQNKSELYRISALLFALNEMFLVEPEQIPDALLRFAGGGAKLMVLTARSITELSTTEAQLDSAGNGNLLTLIEKHAPKLKATATTASAGAFVFAGQGSCEQTNSVIYQRGIMYLTGQNKGNSLLCFLEIAELEDIERIVFLDDTLRNVTDVIDASHKAPDILFSAYHYTYLEAHKNALGASEVLQHNASKRWNNVAKVLHENLAEPILLSD